MAISQQKAEIVRVEKLTSDIFRFTLKAPDMATVARPGQFVMMRTGEGLDPLLRRASISSDRPCPSFRWEKSKTLMSRLNKLLQYYFYPVKSRC